MEFINATLLMLVCIGIVCATLILSARRLGSVDRGFNYILIGSCIIFGAGIFDYLEEVPAMTPYFQMIFDRDRLGPSILPIIYAPGVLLIGLGLARWLPAIRRVSHEVERRERAEEELRALFAETQRLAVKAEEANQAKSEFLATMSHELRTPLNAVMGFTEMLLGRAGAVDDQKREEYLKVIHTSSSHLLTLINEILDIAKLEAGKIDVKEEPFDVAPHARDCLAYVAGMCAEKSIGLSSEIAEVRVESDSRLIRQILINLLSNAAKYTPDGGDVRLEAAFANDMLTYRVIDTGIGMTEDQLSRVLEPFVRVDSAYARQHDGAGLGLTIVDRFVRLLGGDFAMASEPGKGTTVTVAIPVRENSDHKYQELFL